MSKLQTPEEIEALQLEGIDRAMRAYDWRYPMTFATEPSEWDLLLTGGKVVTIWCPSYGAERIEQAAERYGDDTLFLIGSKGKWS